MRRDYEASEIANALSAFPDAGELVTKELFASGFDNSNFDVHTTKGRFVLKIYELELSEATIAIEIEAIATCGKQGIPVPRIYETRTGELYTRVQGKPAIMMSFVEGAPVTGTTIRASQAHELGKVLAQLDHTLAEVPRDAYVTNNEFSLILFDKAMEYVAALPQTIDRTEFTALFEQWSTARATITALPRQLVHNDAVLHNIFFLDNRVTSIIDFSDMVVAPVVQELAVTLAQSFIREDAQPNLASVCLAGYEAVRPLTTQERALLPLLIRMRHAMIALVFSEWVRRDGPNEEREAFIQESYRSLLIANAATSNGSPGTAQRF